MPRPSVPVVAYPEDLKLCPACELHFAPNPKARNQPIYCSPSCRTAGFKQRQELAAAEAAAARRRRRKSAA